MMYLSTIIYELCQVMRGQRLSTHKIIDFYSRVARELTRQMPKPLRGSFSDKYNNFLQKKKKRENSLQMVNQSFDTLHNTGYFFTDRLSNACSRGGKKGRIVTVIY